jgi:heavy metal sensor kinase
MLYKSIRWRIQAWHGVLLACLVAGMLGAFFNYERGERLRAVDSQLQSVLTPLLPRLMPPGGPGFDEGPPPGRDDGPERRPMPNNRVDFPEFQNGTLYYAAWSPRRDLTGHAGTLPPKPERDKSGKQQIFLNRAGNRELVYFGPRGDCVLVGASLTPIDADLRRLAWKLLGVGVALVVFGLAGGWWAAGFALRPIDEISAAARQIAGGNRAKRIDVKETEGELGQLAEVLNKTFDKLDSVFEQQVRFTADASHELRTPVSVILTQTQLALSRDRDAREYRETLQVCQRAAERMRALVNSLLELARVDSGDFQLNLAECDLSTVATDALDLIAPLALEKRATLRSEVEAVKTSADSAKLGQVLVNFLYNAIQHNTKEVEVSLSIQRDGNEAVLRVSDNGMGIPAEALPHVFERFYRADKSRTGSRNGSGLGLAISQAIIQAHGGRISAESEPGKGAVFTVRLPLAN